MAAEPFRKGPLKGNLAAAYAAMDASIDVCTAYPITPQTTVVETLSELVGMPEFINRGQNVHYMKMESEHSVAAGLVGASYAGARAYSATAGQGLLYMNEMIHWMVGARLPIVLSISSRGLTGGGWNIWVDYGDVINVRDSGVMIQFLGSHQEIYDTILQGFNITEHPDVMLPLLPAYGGFTLSHTAKPVERASWEEAQSFVKPKTDEWPHMWIDSERPIMEGALIMPNREYMEYHVKVQEAQVKALQVIKDTMSAFEKKFGRTYGNGLTVPYKCDDADVIMMSYGATAIQIEDAIDIMRDQGYKVGALRIRTYRPFPTEDIMEYAKKVDYIGVIDRAMAYGNVSGSPLAADVMSACQRYTNTQSTRIVPFVGGLGGRDVTQEEQIDQIKIMFELKETGKLPERDHKMWGTYWTGLITKGKIPPKEEDFYFGDI